MRLLAIDPGPTHSAYVVVEDDLKPHEFGKLSNEDMLDLDDLYYADGADYLAIEMIGHYGTGMPAGQTVFDTCVWIGRFWQAAYRSGGPIEVSLVTRNDVKMHWCGNKKAKDGNVIQALIDRFAPDTRNAGKGVKNQPGWFYGFHSDIWQAYALAVYYHDTHIA